MFLYAEKKLLQSKLRRASAGGMSVDINHGHSKKDASTCTSDLGSYMILSPMFVCSCVNSAVTLFFLIQKSLFLLDGEYGKCY